MINRTNNLGSIDNGICSQSLALRFRANQENSQNITSPKNDLDNVKLTQLLKKDSHKTQDELVPNDFISKTRAGIEQTARLPEYAVRGLKGDPDANFYEFLKLAKIPYYVGGLVLIGCFAAGGRDASAITRQKAVGVAMYYLAAMAASKAIDIPIRLFRGVDLEQSYKKVVSLRTQSPNGVSLKRKEVHNVYESIDFTYTDLLRVNDNSTTSNHRLIKKQFDKIAKEMGIKEELNDSDSAVKPYIKKLIVMASAWKYMLTIPFTILAIGLSAQDGWKSLGNMLSKDLSQNVTSKKIGIDLLKGIGQAAKGAALTLKQHSWSALTGSVKDFWNGRNAYGLPKAFGKLTILGTAAALLVANLSILRATSTKSKKIVNVSQYPDGREDKRRQMLNNGFEIASRSQK